MHWKAGSSAPERTQSPHAPRALQSVIHTPEEPTMHTAHAHPRQLALALALLGLAGAAQALTFTDSFDSGVIDPVWWTAGAEGGSSVVAVNGRLELTQGASGFAALSMKLPVTGDFSATLDYALLEWPADNQERLVLNAWAGPTQQLLIERISDSQYDTTRVGEVYITDFTGQGLLGTPTTDRSGTLRLQRSGNVVQGSFRNGSDWTVIGTYNHPGEGEVGRLLGFGIFGGNTTTAGVKVALDNFALNAPTMPVPEPGALWLLLAGLGSLGGWRVATRRAGA
jgi:PEP-CTERM motif